MGEDRSVEGAGTDKARNQGNDRKLALAIQECSKPRVILDAAGNIVALNERMVSFLVVDEDEAPRAPFLEVLSTRGLVGPVQQALSESLEPGQKVEFSTFLETESATKMRQVVKGSVMCLDSDRWLVTLDRTLEELSLLRRRAEAVSHISHNMRSSLTSVRGFAELLLMRQFGAEEVKEFLGHIHREGLVLQHMVDALSTYVYYQSGRALNWPVNTWRVGKLVELALNELRSEHPDSELQVTLDAPETLLLGNIEHLSFGLSKVMENAVLFGSSNDGNPARVVGRSNGEWYIIEVADQGPGMSPKERRRAFEPFFSGMPASKQSRPRMGLGLTVARYTVEVHGGSIILDSSPGSGTKVTISLPRMEGPS